MGSIIMRKMTSVIEAWRLLDSVRRRFGDDVPAAGQEECFHAFNLHVHDVVLDAHLQGQPPILPVLPSKLIWTSTMN